jgi:hypothetical protein
MNPFELQAELARQWFALVGGLASTALTVWTPQGDGSGAHPDRLRSTRPTTRDAASAATPAPPLNSSRLFINPMLVLAPWVPWACPAPVLNPWASFLGPRIRDVDVAGQATANYRSAGGHAVASIIAPGRTETAQRP